jgi:hypothetical protein
MAGVAGGWLRFLVIVGGIALVLGWLAWAVVDNGGPLCGPENPSVPCKATP